MVITISFAKCRFMQLNQTYNILLPICRIQLFLSFCILNKAFSVLIIDPSKSTHVSIFMAGESITRVTRLDHHAIALLTVTELS